MKNQRVVLDTNILVAALRSRRGASHKLLLCLAEGAFIPCISVPLFLEYEDVLKRPGKVPGLAAKDIDDILDFILSQSDIRQIFFLWRPFLKDPKDDLVLEVAVESRSQYIVTHNTKDFNNVSLFGLKAITPRDFLEALKEDKS